MSVRESLAEENVYLTVPIWENETMSTRELIARELEQMPESLQNEVYDFVRFIKLKSGDDSFNGLLASESALAKDWNSPEEDAAWATL